ncbi:MAG: cobalamin-binding protein [Proteobacteria bacterium]|nr:cobalamin-binding protein [Pseudomonadota bacterium]
MTEIAGPRIVSLLASATEIVCALGFEQALVAVSHECDFPETARVRPSCTWPVIDISKGSAEIDSQIKDIVARGLSVYRVDADKLKQFRPDIVVTQTQCEVCAVSEADVVEALADWTGTRPRLVSLRPDSLDDIWRDIRAVAAALEAPDRGETLVEAMRARMAAVAARHGDAPKPRVACIEWIEPLMAAGNWMPELVTMAGGENLFGVAGRHSPWMDWADLAAADPDIMVVLPCGFDIARCRAEMPALERQPGWSDLRAVRAGRVVLADGNQYFNRPGPRIADSLEILADILHGPTGRSGGRGWLRHGPGSDILRADPARR